MNENIPIRTKFDEDDKLVRVLFIEEWYDTIKPWINYLRNASGTIAISGIPSELNPVWELITTNIAEFSGMGWTFTISIMAILKLVVQGAISMGKFTYTKVGGLGQDLGVSLGVRQTIINEFPVQS